MFLGGGVGGLEEEDGFEEEEEARAVEELGGGVRALADVLRAWGCEGGCWGGALRVAGGSVA